MALAGQVLDFSRSERPVLCAPQGASGRTSLVSEHRQAGAAGQVASDSPGLRVPPSLGVAPEVRVVPFGF